MSIFPIQQIKIVVLDDVRSMDIIMTEAFGTTYVLLGYVRFIVGRTFYLGTRFCQDNLGL